MRKTCSQQSHERNLRTLEKEIGLEERRNKGDIEIFFFQYQGIDFISNIEGSMLYGWIFTCICQKDVTVNIINIQISNISVCLNVRRAVEKFILHLLIHVNVLKYNVLIDWCPFIHSYTVFATILAE